MDIEWTKPTQTFGLLKGYRVRYGHLGQKLTEILITDANVMHQKTKSGFLLSCCFVTSCQQLLKLEADVMSDTETAELAQLG